MQPKILFRNPSTGLVEAREFADRAKYQAYVTNKETGNIELKEYASDAPLGLVRIADPVLTTIAQGYQPQKTFIGEDLMVDVEVQKETGRFPAFGAESLLIPEGLKRGIGQKVVRLITQSGWVPFSIDEYAEGFDIDDREVNEWAAGGDQLLTARQNTVDSQIGLKMESLIMTLMTTYANYASGFYFSGASKDWTNSGDPVKDMLQLVSLVRKQNAQISGLKAWFTPTSWYLFTNNLSTVNRIKYGGTPIDPAQLYVAGEAAVAKLLGVDEVKVAWASYRYGTTGGFKQTTGTADWLWESVGNACAGVCVVGAGWMVPSFGYTYRRKGTPYVQSWYDNSVTSMKYDTHNIKTPAITKNDGGALYYNLA